MALSQLQLQTSARLCLEAYEHHRDWLARTIDGTLYIAIEGTDCPTDWRRNLEFVFTASDLHAGFQNYSTLLMAQMWSAGVDVSCAQHVVVSGHSLGGAVATIIASDLQGTKFPLDLVTFGSPRPGGAKFRERMQVPHHRFVYGMDPVPHLPPFVFGFRHASPEIRLHKPDGSLLDAVSDHAMSTYLDLIVKP